MDFVIFILARAGSKRLPGKNVMAFRHFNDATFRHFPDAKSIVDVAIDKSLRFVDDKDALLIVDSDIDSILCKYHLGYGEKIRMHERLAQFRGDDVNPVDVLMEHIRIMDPEDWPGYVILTQATSPNWDLSELESAFRHLKLMKGSGLFTVNPAYKPNGCFYIMRTRDMMEQRTLFVEDCEVHCMNWRGSLDIDHIWDMRATQAVIEGRAFGYSGD